jgi:hypothetical protein
MNGKLKLMMAANTVLLAVLGSMAKPQQHAMQPDQVNTGGWKQAWTNLVNDVEESFVPTLPKLQAVEVELLVGNRQQSQDRLTLTVLDAFGRVVVSVSQNVLAEKCDHVLFAMPSKEVAIMPGQTYNLKLSGGTTFGWKYIVGGYPKGEATFNGKPLVEGTRTTFLFRTFGTT